MLLVIQTYQFLISTEFQARFSDHGVRCFPIHNQAGRSNNGEAMKRKLLNSIQFENLPPVGYMRLHQVLKLIPVSKSTWWAGCKSGRS